MNISEERWAQIGKVLTVIGGLAAFATIVFTLMKIAEMLQAPKLVAVVQEINSPLSPKYRDQLKDRIDRDRLISFIESKEQNNEPPSKILDAIKKGDHLKPFAALDWIVGASRETTLYRISIKNDSDELASDVSVVLPGAGTFQMSESSYSASRETPAEWAKKIPIGVLRPNATVFLLVWPDVAPTENIRDLHPALVHSKGLGTIRYVHEFHGWDADIAAWFLSQHAILWVGLFTSVIISVSVVALFRRHAGIHSKKGSL